MTHLSPQQFSAHLDCALHGASLQTVETHLESCEKCRDELAALTLQDQVLGEALRGETDRELFELIGLRVQSVVHPQRARALEKPIAELERTREERRRHAEAVARRVTEERQHAPAGDAVRSVPPPPAESVPHVVVRSAPIPPAEPAPRPVVRPAPPPHAETGAHGAAAAASGEPDAHMSPAGELRRRALDEARVRAEAEARAFALESERVREEAERRALAQAAERARNEVAARRKAGEEGRARAAASARAEAEELARTAEAALAQAETSARDAMAAKVRADARAAAAEEARRQARRKADEARRLEDQLADQEAGGTRAAENFLLASSEPATLNEDEVDAYRERPLDEGEDRPSPRRVAMRRPPAGARQHRASRRSPALLAAAAALILLAGFWFTIGRQLVHWPGNRVPASAAVETPVVSDSAATQETAAVPEVEAPRAPEPALSAPRPRRAAASEPTRSSEPPLSGSSGQATLIQETQSSSVSEAEDETPADLGLLCGTVRDEEHHPIAGARVLMADVGVVVVTDRVGRFCLTAPRGVRTLSVIALGFGTHRETVSVGRRTSELAVTLRTATPAQRSPAR